MLSSDRVPVTADIGVYPPQHDSHLLISAMRRFLDVSGRSVLDLCTGSGVVAIAAAQLGAASVVAVDICPRAVRCARSNATAGGVDVDVRNGGHESAIPGGPYDVVLSNPPYVPTGPGVDALPPHLGPPRAWDAGPDGRLVLDPLCNAAADLLAPGGSLLMVQSEFANPQQSLRQLRRSGLNAYVTAAQRIPFGPVLNARARWLERIGAVPIGRRSEALVVIRADRP